MARSQRKRLRREQAMGQWGGACRATRGRPGMLQCKCATPGPGGDAWERAHLRADHLAQLHTFAP